MKRSLLIYGENFVNSQNTYTLSSGTGAEYLYDQKYDTQYSSSLSSEGTAETIQIDFNDRSGLAVSRTIDTIMLMNCNFKNFKIEYWDGASWILIPESDYTVKDNVQANLLIEMSSPISTMKIKITATHTISGENEKRLGEIKACLFILEVRSPFNFIRSDWENGGNYRLYNGTLILYTNVVKVDGSISFTYMSKEDYNKIINKIRNKEWLTIIPYYGFMPNGVYEIKASFPISGHKYDFITDRLNFSFDFKER